ncbi:MAG: two-component system regulatory protein YycI [Anaerovoracaceae bacterium]|nr:hypothetical protein [Clostridiales bacterium]
MDWAKAKTILIIALILTNIFLFIIYKGDDSGSDSYGFDEETLIQVLQERGVFLDMKMPLKQKDMEVLTVKVINIDDSVVKAVLESDIDGTLFTVNEEKGEKDYLKKAENLLTALGLLNAQVSYDTLRAKDNMVILSFNNFYEAVPLKENEITITFKEGVIFDVNISMVEVVDHSKRKVKIIEPAVALLSLATTLSENETKTIKEMKIVYYMEEKDIDDSETLIDTVYPFWELLTEDNETIYINAAQF